MNKTLLLLTLLSVWVPQASQAQLGVLQQARPSEKRMFALGGFNTNPKQFMLPQLAPKSPNIASFQRYGDIPVSMSTGIPQVSIPLTEIRVDGLSIPLELSYHNNGYKPKDIASWVGYGWNLQPVGAITCDLQGLNDFAPGGICSNYSPVSNYRRGLMNAEQQALFFEDIIEGYQDSEFDKFQLNLMGTQHLFYFDTLQQIIITPKSDLLIRRTSAGFKVIDHQGNQFFFEDVEGSTSEDASDLNFRQTGGTNTYLISKILTKNGREIRFRYKFFYYSFNFTTAINRYRFPIANETTFQCPVNGMQYADTHIGQDVMLLDSIIYDEGYVKFNRTAANRQDLSMFITSGVPALESIQVVNNKGKTVNQFNLLQSYNTKLRLNGVQEKVGTTTGRTWEFSYFPGGDDGFNSYRVDHWGYSNGQNNSSLVPEADYKAIDLPTLGSADRTSNFTYAKGGLLRSIKYPTGGATEFEWEPNQIKVPSKAWIEDKSAFLRWKKTDFPVTVVSLADGNSETNASGTFTLTEESTCLIDYYYELDPGQVMDAIIVFTGPQDGVDNLWDALNSYACAPSPYCMGSREVVLPAGSYTWNCYTGWNTYASPMTSLSSRVYLRRSYIDPNLPVPPFELPGGRIKKVISRDSTGVNPPVIKEYVYNDTLPNVSLKNIPNYLTFSNVQTSTDGWFCNDCGLQYNIAGESVAPMAGSTIEYGKVTELYDSSGRGGKIDYTFSFSSNIQGDPFVQPQVAPFNTFWSSGSLLNKSFFKKEATGYVKVKEITNTYATDDQSGFMPGMKVGYSSYCNLFSSGGVATRTYRVNPVYLGASRFTQTQTVDRTYTNDTIERTDNFSYSSTRHLQLSDRETFDSKEQSVREKIFYAKDYVNRNLATAGEALSIRKMADTNLLVPVETVKIKKIGGVDYVIGATLNIFRSDKAVLSKVYGLKNTAPIPLSSFTFSTINASGAFIKDTNYEERINYNKVDNFGNIVEMQKKDDVIMSMIYDYKKLYVIAEVVGADSASVAHTSFEADGSGNWNIASAARITNDGLTGTSSYQLSNGAISKSGLLTTKEYILSYWTKNTSALTIAGTQGTAVQSKQKGAWRCFTHRISGVASVTLSGTAILDQVSLYPAGSRMTTWCYEPMVGVISHCSPNNVLLYYEYDPLGRLAVIRDQNNNILKKIDYQYNVSE